MKVSFFFAKDFFKSTWIYSRKSPKRVGVDSQRSERQRKRRTNMATIYHRAQKNRKKSVILVKVRCYNLIFFFPIFQFCVISRIFPTIFTFFWAHCDEWEWTTAAALTEEFIFYRFLHLLWGSISTVRRWQLLKRSHTKKKCFAKYFFSHFQIWPKITFLSFELKKKNILT